MKVAIMALMGFTLVNLAAIVPVMLYLMYKDSEAGWVAGPPIWLYKWLIVAAVPLLPAIVLLIINWGRPLT